LVAEVYDEVCYYLIGSSGHTVVTIRSAADAEGTIVLAPYGQWSAGKGNVKLRWRGSRVLEITVPNRTTPYNHHPKWKGIDVVLHYENDDPADRQKWNQEVEEFKRRREEERRKLP